MVAVEELERKEQELKAQLEIADSLAERKQLRLELREVRQQIFDYPTTKDTATKEKNILNTTKNEKNDFVKKTDTSISKKSEIIESKRIAKNKESVLPDQNNETSITDCNNNIETEKNSEQDMSVTIRARIHSNTSSEADTNNNSVNTATDSNDAVLKSAEARAERRARRAAHLKALAAEKGSIETSTNLASQDDTTASSKGTVHKQVSEERKEEIKSPTFVVSTPPKTSDDTQKSEVTNSSRSPGLTRASTWSTNRTAKSPFTLKKFQPPEPARNSPQTNHLSINQTNGLRSTSPRTSPRSSPRSSPRMARKNEAESTAPDLKRQSVADRMAFFRQAQEQEKKDIEKRKAQEEQRKRLSSVETTQPKVEEVKKEEPKPIEQKKEEPKKEEPAKKPEEEKPDSEKKHAAPCMKKREKKKPVRRTMSIGSIVLDWVQEMIRDYPVEVKNFSGSWNDGMAFCALIHKFNPDAFDFNELKPENKRHNFDLAFKTGLECKNIPILLDTEDMVAMARPEPRSVQTYIQWIWSVYGPTSGYGPTPKEIQSASLS